MDSTILIMLLNQVLRIVSVTVYLHMYNSMRFSPTTLH